MLCTKVQAQPGFGSLLISGGYGSSFDDSNLPSYMNRASFNTQFMEFRLGGFITKRTLFQLFYSREFIDFPFTPAIYAPSGRNSPRFARDIGFGILIRPTLLVAPWMSVGMDIGPGLWRRIDATNDKELLSGGSILFNPVMSFFIGNRFGLDLRFIRTHLSMSLENQYNGYFSYFAKGAFIFPNIQPGMVSISACWYPFVK